MRLAVSGYYNTNSLGERIWKEKALGSTLKKSRLRNSVDVMVASFKKIALITPEGVKDAFEVTIEKAPINRSLVRITAGLLSVLYPEVDRNELSFAMTQLDQFKLNDPGFRRIQNTLRYLHKGNGVHRCWHYVETTYSLKGLWVHMFFDSAAFLVEQRSERLIVPPW